ncbi:MAG: ABC transporter ATP-binding protein [Corynebacterium glucuronolyticum]|nr:ABC transporter ATP-binding protein [Mycobacteriaceae bacterium]MDY5833240.1 ABC transporter ATP-binding protein [Corynebacterium glucuronolyticum]
MSNPRPGKNRKTAHSSDKPQVENATVHAEDDDVKENLVEDPTVGEEDKTRTGIWRQIAGTARCLRYLIVSGWGVARREMVLSMFGLISALMTTLYPFAIAGLVGGLARHDETLIIFSLAGLAVYSIVPSFLSAMGVHYRLRVADKIGHHFDREIADYLSRPRTLSVFYDSKVADALGLLIARKGTLGQSYNILGSVAPLFISQVVLLVLAVLTDWRLIFVAIAGLGETLFQAKVMAWQAEADDASAPYVRQIQQLVGAGLDPQMSADLRTLNSQSDLHEILRKRVHNWRAPIHVRDNKQAAVSIGSSVVFYAVAAAVLISMGVDTVHGHVSIEQLTAACALVPKLTNSLAMVLASVTALGSSVHAVDRYLWLASHIERMQANEANNNVESANKNDEPGTLPDGVASQQDTVAVADGYSAGDGAPIEVFPHQSLFNELRYGIDVDHLTITYPGRDSPALSDLSFHIPAGQVLAIVGENGAGKTTLSQCLLGLLDYDGHIAVDGKELSGIDIWHSRVSAVFQDYLRPRMIAAEALTLGCVDGRGGVFGSAEVAAQAISRAGVEEVLEALPDGLSTPLGLEYGGKQLSGGQWQKIALARGCTRPHPLLLVLDEPTSALDPESEKRLFSAYERIAKDNARYGGITVIVSHRLPSTLLADEVLVLDHGELVEFGSPEALLRAGGYYAELRMLQAAGYRDGDGEEETAGEPE